MNPNLHLSYFGGSGGFFALWHLLVGTDYKCTFNLRPQELYDDIKGPDWPVRYPNTLSDLPHTVQKEIEENNEWQGVIKKVLYDNKLAMSVDSIVYKDHWNISKDGTNWKSSEMWPDNNLTQLSDHKHKLFYICGPTVDTVSSTVDTKILLYTDYKTQDMLAKTKNAWKYNPQIFVRDATKTTEFAGDTVYYKVAEIAEYTDYQIKLQDIIKTNGQALLDILNIPINENNIYHNNMWLNLHTNEERKQLLNEPQNS